MRLDAACVIPVRTEIIRDARSIDHVGALIASDRVSIVDDGRSIDQVADVIDQRAFS